MSTEIKLLGLFIVVNLIAFVLMGLDKSYARQGHYRISEDMLITMALIGGSIGIMLGTIRFRHKTKKLKFAFGIPAILFAQSVLLIIVLYPALIK